MTSSRLREPRRIDSDADLKARAYNKAWRLAHPGYHAEKSKQWRACTNDTKRDYRDRHPGYRALENWRRKCNRETE
jgi:hypothetical protein